MGLLVLSVPAASMAEIDLKMDFGAFGTFGGSMTSATEIVFYDPITKSQSNPTPTIVDIGKYPDFADDTMAGLRFGAEVNDQFSFVVELLSRGAQEYNVHTDLLYAQWNFLPTWNVRVGRSRLPFYLYSEYAQVGHSYLWSRLPLEVYILDPFTNFDGFTLNFRQNLPDTWFVNASLNFGNSDFDFQQGGVPIPFSLSRAGVLDLMVGNQYLKLNAGGMLGSIDADYSNVEAGQVRQDLLNPCAAFTQLEPAEIILTPNGVGSCTVNALILGVNTGPFVFPDPVTANLFNSKNVNTSILTFGYEFKWNHIISMAEWTQFNADDDYIIDTRSWYATLGFYFNDITVAATYSSYRTTDNGERNVQNTIANTYINPVSFYLPNNPIPLPETLQDSVNQFLNLSNVSQATLNFTVRYDLADTIDVKFDYRYVYPRDYSAGLFDFPPGKRISWVTAVIDMVF
jgi:hypothetical protein